MSAKGDFEFSLDVPRRPMVPRGGFGWRGYVAGLAPVVIVLFVLAGLIRTLDYPLPFENTGAGKGGESAAEAAGFIAAALAVLAAALLPVGYRLFAGVTGETRYTWSRAFVRFRDATEISPWRVWQRYGCEPVLWPLLRRLIPDDDAVRCVAAERQRDLTLAASVGLTLAFVFALGFGAAYATSRLEPALMGLGVSLATSVLARQTYRSACRAAVGYGREVEWAFDLHRTLLLRQMGLPLPDNAREERTLFIELARTLVESEPLDIPYWWGDAGGEGLARIENRLRETLMDFEPAVRAGVGAAVEELMPSAVAAGVVDALRGGPPVNFEGWTCVAVLIDGHVLPISQSHEVPLKPGQSFEVVVSIDLERQHSDDTVCERLSVSGGVDRPSVEFGVAVDSDRPELRRPRTSLTVEPGHAPAQARFAVRPDQAYEQPPWLWVRISQGRRTVQSVHLSAGTSTGEVHK